MADDPRTTERVHAVAVELAAGHLGDQATRAAFLERAIEAEAVDRIARSVEDSELRIALDADTDVAYSRHSD